MKREKIKRHLADPEFFQENRMDPVSDHKWYETETEALREAGYAVDSEVNALGVQLRRSHEQLVHS